MNNTTNFYATDRDIFEALTSKKKKITTEILHELCYDRGIILSQEDDRESIIEYISTLQHDYNDFDHIMRLIAANSRSEKITYDDVPVGISNEEIKGIIDFVSEKRNQNEEKYSVVVESKDRTVVKVDYTEMDYSMTRLRQRTEKEAYIEITKENGITKFRRPANEKVDEIMSAIYKQLDNEKQTTIERTSISLQGISDPNKRTKFFTDLISKSTELVLSDVTSIKVDKLGEQTPVKDDEEDEFDAEREIVTQKMLGHVRKAALDGEGLLYSPEFQHLSSQGFFISSIVWQAIEKVKDPLKIEFEASFGNPIEGKDFRYNAKCYFKAKEGKYTSTRRQLEDHEKTKYFKIIEESAMKTMLEIYE